MRKPSKVKLMYPAQQDELIHGKKFVRARDARTSSPGAAEAVGRLSEIG